MAFTLVVDNVHQQILVVLRTTKCARASRYTCAHNLNTQRALWYTPVLRVFQLDLVYEVSALDILFVYSMYYESNDRYQRDTGVLLCFIVYPEQNLNGRVNYDCPNNHYQLFSDSSLL